jgi:hypothetical protein
MNENNYVLFSAFYQDRVGRAYRVKIWITVSKSLRVPALLNFSLQVENYKQVL